jgi:hypothetical protein
MDELSYKDEIESLRDDPEFESKGDAIYLYHEDDYARLEWAFYRPSGSHPDQVSDKNPMVSIMAFNHSRLGAYERFTRLHPDVIAKDHLRVKVRNRSRMLFRAMVDDDLTELIKVLTYAPVFLETACDQMIHGRIWNEHYADLEAASTFLNLVEHRLDKELSKGLIRRLQPIKKLGFEEAKDYLEYLGKLVQNLHIFIKEHYIREYSSWLESTSLHPLQRIALKKQIDNLKE